MSISVEFSLHRRGGVDASIERASALFVPGRDAADVWAAIARTTEEQGGLARIFDIAGGFLIALERPTNGPLPGAVRLRALGEGLYVPIDAELVPALLDDELAGLTRDAGLVFLPGGRVLSFDLRAPLEMSALIALKARPRRAWTSLPAPKRLADRLVAIVDESPETGVDERYRELEREAREDEDGGLGDRQKGGVARPGKRGTRLSSLREKLHWEWADHSTLVRRLLREFREGDPSKALRHALPMRPATPGGRIVSWGFRLPWSRAIYNLMDMLKTPGRGGIFAVWSARPNLMAELTAEYHNAARRALEQGDCRRAAYIYGMLLNDHRAAARALQQGGLHHDAALIYLRKVNDRMAAAQAFEAAGMADRALELYRELKQHENAGDLLRRIGEEDAAIIEYTTAARLASEANPPRFHRAGEILWKKARRPELAMEMFQKGWDNRPGDSDVVCALNLIQIHGERGAIDPIRALYDEADAFFRAADRSHSLELFFNRAPLIAARTPALAPFADELRDRSLTMLTWRLERDIEAGRPAAPGTSKLFGKSPLWPAEMVRDAEFAASALRNRLTARAEKIQRTGQANERRQSYEDIRVGQGTVTAVAQASNTYELFLGFDNGEVLAFQPKDHEVPPISVGPGTVTALAVDPEGEAIVQLRQREDQAMLLSTLKKPDGSFRRGGERSVDPGSWLTPVWPWGEHWKWMVGVGTENALRIWNAATMAPEIGIGDLSSPTPLATAFVFNDVAADNRALSVLACVGPYWTLPRQDRKAYWIVKAPWCPAVRGPGPLRRTPLFWSRGLDHLALVGLDDRGAVHATQFHVDERDYINGQRFESLASCSASTDGGYLAATRLETSTIVAVSANRIDWLRDTGERLRLVGSLTDLNLRSVVACFPAGEKDEVLLVFSDGVLRRVRRPPGLGP